MNLASKTTLNAKINEIKGELRNINNLATNASLNAKIDVVKGEIADITNLATTSVLTAVENKIPSVYNLVKKKLTIRQKLMKLKRNLVMIVMINILFLHNFNKFAKETFDLRSKYANLASSSEFVNFINKTF